MSRHRAFIAALGVSGSLLISASLIVPQEDVVNKAYIPMPGDVPTICVGETQGVTLDMYLDDLQCGKIFKGRLPEYHEKVRRNVKVEMTPHTEAAFASFVYNVGEGAFKGSTMLKLYNSGKKVEACEQLRRWVYGPAAKGGIKDKREPAIIGSQRDMSDGKKDGLALDGKIDGKTNCSVKENGCGGLPSRREKERETCLK